MGNGRSHENINIKKMGKYKACSRHKWYWNKTVLKLNKGIFYLQFQQECRLHCQSSEATVTYKQCVTAGRPYFTDQIHCMSLQNVAILAIIRLSVILINEQNYKVWKKIYKT